MARIFKRDALGQFASGGGSSKSAKSTPKTASKPAAKSTPKSAAKPTWQERSAAFGEKIGNKLVSPERKEYRRKKTLETRQYERELSSPKSNYINADRDVALKSAQRRAEMKAQFKAAQAAKKAKKKS